MPEPDSGEAHHGADEGLVFVIGRPLAEGETGEGWPGFDLGQEPRRSPGVGEPFVGMMMGQVAFFLPHFVQIHRQHGAEHDPDGEPVADEDAEAKHHQKGADVERIANKLVRSVRDQMLSLDQGSRSPTADEQAEQEQQFAAERFTTAQVEQIAGAGFPEDDIAHHEGDEENRGQGDATARCQLQQRVRPGMQSGPGGRSDNRCRCRGGHRRGFRRETSVAAAFGFPAESTHVALCFRMAGYTVAGEREASSIAGNQFIVGSYSAGKDRFVNWLQQVASTCENAFG